MARAIIISGLLHNLSDNFIRFVEDLKDEVHVYVHTWDDIDNLRWVNKLLRYQDRTRITVNMEPCPDFEKKYLILHSTYKAVNLISDLNKYETIIKFKPDLDTEHIPYNKTIEKYYTEAYLHTYPLMEGKAREDFIYGRVLYKTLDERMFSAYPSAIEKLFRRPYNDYFDDIHNLDKFLQKKYTKNYEGSILWTNYIKERGLDIIQDLTLQIPNCKPKSY